jgi:hypothetical protein
MSFVKTGSRFFRDMRLVPLRPTAGRCTLNAEIVVRIHEGEPDRDGALGDVDAKATHSGGAEVLPA